MDLGATVCTPRSPACGICPWVHACAGRAAGIAADLPRKAAKTAKPVRYGIAWVGGGRMAPGFSRRGPESGLLGGMLGWPGTDWSEAPLGEPPVAADWRDPGAEVRHTFTHFHLRLALRVARLPLDAAPSRGVFVPAAAFRPASLPTVMRKALDLASPALRDD
jgi:A/G-specific adenine glycosylase